MTAYDGLKKLEPSPLVGAIYCAKVKGGFESVESAAIELLFLHRKIEFLVTLLADRNVIVLDPAFAGGDFLLSEAK